MGAAEVVVALLAGIALAVCLLAATRALLASLIRRWRAQEVPGIADELRRARRELREFAAECARNYPVSDPEPFSGPASRLRARLAWLLETRYRDLTRLETCLQVGSRPGLPTASAAALLDWFFNEPARWWRARADARVLRAALPDMASECRTQVRLELETLENLPAHIFARLEARREELRDAIARIAALQSMQFHGADFDETQRDAARFLGEFSRAPEQLPSGDLAAVKRATLLAHEIEGANAAAQSAMIARLDGWQGEHARAAAAVADVYERLLAARPPLERIAPVVAERAQLLAQWQALDRSLKTLQDALRFPLTRTAGTVLAYLGKPAEEVKELATTAGQINSDFGKLEAGLVAGTRALAQIGERMNDLSQAAELPVRLSASAQRYAEIGAGQSALRPIDQPRSVAELRADVKRCAELAQSIGELDAGVTHVEARRLDVLKLLHQHDALLDVDWPAEAAAALALVDGSPFHRGNWPQGARLGELERDARALSDARARLRAVHDGLAEDELSNGIFDALSRDADVFKSGAARFQASVDLARTCLAQLETADHDTRAILDALAPALERVCGALAALPGDDPLAPGRAALAALHARALALRERACCVKGAGWPSMPEEYTVDVLETDARALKLDAAEALQSFSTELSARIAQLVLEVETAEQRCADLPMGGELARLAQSALRNDWRRTEIAGPDEAAGYICGLLEYRATLDIALAALPR